ncbi:MAG: hypothetical protein AAGG75_13920 [Bacteroidota bacterium]
MSQVVKLHMYQLKSSSDPVTVSVTIGNQQRASTDLYLDGVKINSDSLVDSFSDQEIGLNNTLSGKQLTINTTVFDINTNNDEVSYRYKVKGGEKVLYPASSKLTVTEGGVAHFFIRVFLL